MTSIMNIRKSLSPKKESKEDEFENYTIAQQIGWKFSSQDRSAVFISFPWSSYIQTFKKSKITKLLLYPFNFFNFHQGYNKKIGFVIIIKIILENIFLKKRKEEKKTRFYKRWGKICRNFEFSRKYEEKNLIIIIYKFH